METKFTNGKWKVKHSETKDAFNVVGTVVGDRYKICRCPYLQDKSMSEDWNKKEKDEQQANALLISKAPEIFADLLDIVWLFERGATYEEIQERALISKQLLKEATEL